ncbi:unnamed protein product [Eruca vesicaria subsp. sativa]|uniref:S-protein homolog n=1 Tax=Eruca vesicaria subsp. sativa TaxID=29727 RepID=A0ABC8KHA4_ERUVS|nr:unnamed protein product [Eruca vesicaria subsp. sativa]
MNLLISFMLVFATYYRFGTACKINRIELHNQLGPGIVLHYYCRDKTRKYPFETQELKFNTTRVLEFKDAAVTYTKTTTDCYFKYGKYYHDFLAYREATLGRCGQLRSYTARKDGIYFTRRYEKPGEFKFHWNVGTFVPKT